MSASEEAELARAVAAFAEGVSTAYLHLDLDVLDPAEYGAANVFSEPGGLRLDDALRVVQKIATRLPISGMTVSAYDPAVDEAGTVRPLPGPIISEVIRCNAERVAAE